MTIVIEAILRHVLDRSSELMLGGIALVAVLVVLIALFFVWANRGTAKAHARFGRDDVEASLRVGEWFRVGDFRLASRCDKVRLQWKPGLDELEAAVSRRCEGLRKMSFAALLNLDADTSRQLVTILDRPGGVLVHVEKEDPDASLRVVVTGGVGMLWWPLGGWMVIDGFRKYPDGSSEALAKDTLNYYW